MNRHFDSSSNTVLNLCLLLARCFFIMSLEAQGNLEASSDTSIHDYSGSISWNWAAGDLGDDEPLIRPARNLPATPCRSSLLSRAHIHSIKSRERRSNLVCQLWRP
ncbi:hypothetical protein QL093DRAFT_2395606 [Fusarium oxysporum]|nr:hypothetical protein QL093DRAFT_2395606 [Fusarium oxysporum]